MYDKQYYPRPFFNPVVKTTPDQYHQGERPFPPFAKFLVGGLAGTTAAFIVHPLDFLKTRMQMTTGGGLRNSLLRKICQIYRYEGGICGFYGGGSACLLKQSVYTTVRLGVYTNLLEVFGKEEGKPSFAVKIFTGTFAGMCSGFVATPLDVCLVRMMYDGCKPKAQRFNYKHPFDALCRIVREENGVRSLYRGAIPTTLRAGVVGIGLATYSQIKQCFKSYFDLEESLKLHVYSSMLSGLVTAFVTMPFDLLKTRAQSGAGDEKKNKMLRHIVAEEGLMALWKGFAPYYARITPITVLTFVLVEQLSYLYNVYVLGNKRPKSNL